MRLPFKRYLLVHYIRWLETAGYLFCAVMIAGMVASVFYKIDDVMKFQGVTVALTSEPVDLPSKVYIEAVLAEDGDEVTEGTPLLKAVTGPQEVAAREAEQQIVHTRGQLAALSPEALGASPVLELLDQSAEAIRSLTGRQSPEDVKAPISGLLRKTGGASLAELRGQIKQGTVASIYSTKALRFKVPVSGNKSNLVRINLLAEDDVSDWRILTSYIKSGDGASASLPIERIRERLKGKLDEVQPGKHPLKRLQADIIAELNALLQKRDFYDPSNWGGARINEEAKALVDKGVDILTHTQLCRLNRLLLEGLLPDAIVTSADKPQAVKAKVIVTPAAEPGAGKDAKPVPTVYRMTGRVVAEPEGGQVLIELSAPEAGLVQSLLRTMEEPGKETIVSSGAVVVGQVSLFRFLFH